MNPDFSCRNRINGSLHMKLEAKHGGMPYTSGTGPLHFCHTFTKLCPPSLYFYEHPEYFSEVNGKRLKERTQLCLTNPDVLRIVTSNVLANIRKDPGKSRTIQTERTPETCASLRVPILGKVRAGLPILAVENREGYVDVSLKGYPQKELFALRVTGDSMIEAGILEGDIIIVHQEAIAENGDIVVALVEDSATVKTFYKENGHFRLQPENASMAPIIVDEVYLLGKVVANLRFY
jgi:repressor LexA